MEVHMSAEPFAGFWGFAIIAGPVILAIIIAYGIMHRRRRDRVQRVSPDYPADRQEAARHGTVPPRSQS
jgi:hypothetical protein